MMNTKIFLSKSTSEFSLSTMRADEHTILEFEKSLENYLGENSLAVALNSGTAAIHLALILSGVVQDDEVFCQTFTFSASANPITYQGAKPVFIDSETANWNMCPIALEEAIKGKISKGKKPKAIIVVHLYGMPAKIDEIVAISKKYEILLIEDAAEALGSTYKGQKCGTFGDFGILSFNSNKIITTSGGGALVCKNEEDKQKTIFLATQAKDEAPHYQHSEIGYNYRMSNVLAGIGRGQMEVLSQHIALRRINNEFYQQLFKDVNGITVFKEPSQDYFSNHWLSCIVIDSEVTGFTREDLRLQLEKDNIESRPLWKAMHLQPVFNDCVYYGGNTAERLFKNGLCLPSGSNLTDADRERIEKSINKLMQFNN
jgi:dTDP-4-amino-4,6-dideoxygalactose transaminase